MTWWINYAFVFIFTVISFWDLETQTIPLALLLLLPVLALAARLFWWLEAGAAEQRLLSSLMTAGVCAGLSTLFFLPAVRKGWMGRGDLPVLAALVLQEGPGRFMELLLTAFLLAGFSAGLTLCFQRNRAGIPLIPFLFLGSLILRWESAV